jgi:non-homologous end joining protein Ku
MLGPFVNAPARIMTAVRDKDSESELHTVCTGTSEKEHPAAKVNQYFRCTHVDPGGKPCGREERSFHPFPRGRENEDGTWVIPKEEDLAGLEATQDMKETLSFLPVRREEIENDAVPFGKFYYVAPASQPKQYALARDIILATRDEWVWVTQWAYRTAPSFVRAVVMNDLLAIQQLALPEQVVARPMLNLPESDPRFLAIALQSVPLLAVSYNAETFPDVRKQKLAEILGSTGAVEGSAAPAAASTPVQDDDAMLLSMQKWLEDRANSVGGAGKTTAKTRTRKAPAKAAGGVPTPRKRAPRKSTSKKESA